MKRLEKAIIVGTLVIGGSLLGYGLHRDNKIPEYHYINSAIKMAGLISFFVYPGGMFARKLVEEGDRIYFKEHRRQNVPQKHL